MPEGYSHPLSRGCSLFLTSVCPTEYIPTLAGAHPTSAVAHVKRKINNHTTLILLDSVASCSVEVGNKYILPEHLRPTK